MSPLIREQSSEKIVQMVKKDKTSYSCLLERHGKHYFQKKGSSSLDQDDFGRVYLLFPFTGETCEVESLR